MANSSFFKNTGTTSQLQTSAQQYADDAEKLAINPEDSQYTLSDGTTTGYSALHHAAKAEDHKTAAATSATSSAASAASASSSAAGSAVSAAQAAASQTAAASSASSAASDATQTAADRVQTGLDATATAADRVQTGLDATATAADAVSTAADAVSTAADAASASSDASAASSSATAALASQNAAATSETNAAASASSASADAASTAADATATAADAVATAADRVQTGLDATAAANSASAASTSATAAAASQVAAASSAASAAAVFNDFEDRYYGPHASDSAAQTYITGQGLTVDQGDLYFNSTANEMRVYDGGNWIAASSAGGASLYNYNYTATASQTTFSGADDNSNTLSYTVDNLIVTRNGVVLEDGTDYTATTGTSVVLAVAATAGDEINIVAFKSFTTADMVSATNGGTFQGNVDFSAGIDVTGNVTVTGTVDGRDVASDGTKLDGIEALADVTDATNVAAAGAAMLTGANFTGNVDVTGDLTVDTNTLYIDSTNNRVGVGTALPARTLSVYGSSAIPVRVESSTSDSQIEFVTSGGNSYLGSYNGNMVALTGGAERLRIDSSGKVGIGTTPSYLLHLSSDDPRIAMTDTTHGTWFTSVGYGGGNDYSINQSGVGTRLLVDSSGNVGIGTSSPTSALDVRETATSVVPLRLETNAGAANTVRPQISMFTQGSNGYHISTIRSNLSNDPYGLAFVENTTERMRIDSSGNLLVGVSSTPNAGKIKVETNDEWTIGSDVNNGTTAKGHIAFYNPNGLCGYISTSGTSTAYNTSSDYRLKENITADWDATTRLKQLNPVRFNFIADADTTVDGFLAHEVQDVVPEAITGTKDGMRDEEYQVSAATGDIYTPAVAATYDDDGVELTAAIDEVIHSIDVERPEELAEGQQWRETTAAVMGTRSVPDYQGIDQSKLVPLLVKTIQELEARITALEAN